MTPTRFPAPLEAARELAPRIRAAADEIERIRELPRPIFEAIADAGLFLMAVPRDIGGSEVDFPTYVRTIEEIGKADASTGWAVNQNATFATLSSRMKPEAAREIWIDTPRSAVANTPAPTAQAIVVPGGYRVTGRQPFSTGCRHASWIAAHGTIIDDGKPRQRNGKPEARYLILPVAQAEILDTWHTRGMRGTGTHEFAVKDVFVPEERTVFPMGMPLVTGGARFKFHMSLSFAAGDAAVALGVARSSLDAFFELAGAKTPRHYTGLLREQALIQLIVGQGEAAWRSGRAFLMETVDQIWHDVTSRGEATLESRVALRCSTTHAIRLASQVVNSIYNVCGATAVFEGHPIQRYFQDINVITQHVQGRLQHYELVGQHALGLPIDDSRI